MMQRVWGTFNRLFETGMRKKDAVVVLLPKQPEMGRFLKSGEAGGTIS